MNMLNSIHAEFYKLKKTRGFKVILLINIILYVAIGFLMCMSADMIPSDLPDGVIITKTDIVLNAYDNFYTALSQVQSNAILLACFIGLFIGGDFSNRTIGLAITSGQTRMTMLISKIIAIMFGAFLILIVVPIVMMTILSLMNGFGVIFTVEIFKEMLWNLILYILINLAIASIFVWVAYLFQSMGITIGVCFGGFILYNILASLPLGETWMDIMSFTPLHYANDISIIQTSDDVIRAILASALTFLVATGLSYITLLRTELK